MTSLPLPTVITQQQSLEDEIAALRMQLHFEKEARIHAETSLLMQDMAQENGDPPASRMAMITGLAKLADSRDDDTGSHLTRIRQYTAVIAGAVAEHNPQILPMGEVSIIAAASILHDIGKVGIADDVLLHPNKLSSAQFEQMKQHAPIGADILIALSEQLGPDPWIDTAIQIALGHHERWDGTGYPNGVEACNIPLAARIVAVADVYDALTSERVYKNSIPHQEAVEIIAKEKGKHFDPMVVDAFLSKLEEVRAINE
ncbi:MAG: HD domain-containing protein [Phycisphaerae bacterium]|nr:HD domain-containing protein [Phycisphaerae bacterium]